MSAESVPVFAFQTRPASNTSTGAGLLRIPKPMLDQGGSHSALLDPPVVRLQQGLRSGVEVRPVERNAYVRSIESGTSDWAEPRTDRGIDSGTIRLVGEDLVPGTPLLKRRGSSAVANINFVYAGSIGDALAATEPSINLYGVEAPAALAYLEPPIRTSRSMLRLGANWDGEGSPGYEESTWRRAVCFLVQATTAFWESERSLPPLPRIGKGPSGSIDIHWLIQGRELLLNFPPDDHPATFFGDDLGGQQRVIEGRIPQGQVGRWLLEWLTT